MIGCGSEPAATEGAGGATSSGRGGAGGSVDAASTSDVGAVGSSVASGAGAAGGGGSAAGAGGGTGSGGASGLATLGTLVVLGDSISDGGGQGPFYYDLLKNDLKAKYGSVEYHNNAESGSKTGALVGQINGLPDTLPGPVAVVITSGGNDMKAAVPQIVTGTDGAARMQMQSNVSAALDALLAPGKFGAGVEVHVYEGNIYDASDGKGDFSAHNCNFGNGLPATPTDGFFDNWNGAILAAVDAHTQVSADMHAHFYGHGYSGSPSWYASDCTHPNTLGHDQLRRLFYLRITGQALP